MVTLILVTSRMYSSVGKCFSFWNVISSILQVIFGETKTCSLQQMFLSAPECLGGPTSFLACGLHHNRNRALLALYKIMALLLEIYEPQRRDKGFCPGFPCSTAMALFTTHAFIPRRSPFAKNKLRIKKEYSCACSSAWNSSVRQGGLA